MTTELLHLELLDNGVSTTDEARSIASNLHTELSAITVVNSPATQSAATEIARDAQSFLKLLEASRKDVKAPILEIGRKVDKLADELAAPVKQEMDRVGKMCSKFREAEQARVAQEAKEKREREFAAMNAKVEADRLAREAEAKITNEADLQAAIKAEAEAKAKQQAMYDELTKPPPAVNKSEGSTTKKVLMIEVLDIHALYKAAPHLVKLEANIAAIKATCNKDSHFPGLKLTEENATSFRSR